MKKVASAALCLTAAGLALAACEGNTTTTTRDFLNASGTVFLNDGKTAVQNLPISQYDWIINYTDGSSVDVTFDTSNANIAGTNASIMTDASGNFNFQSDQLQLQSGTQVQSCTNVCVQTAVGYDDTCVDWQISYQDYCANWASGGQSCSPGTGSTGTGSTGTGSTGTGSTGGSCVQNPDVCTDWQTQEVSTCDSWVSQEYTYCTTYAQDCGWIYPDRDVTDIKSAYSEITYTNGTSTVQTRSDSDILAKDAASTSSKQDPNNSSNNIETELWHQVDHYTTPFIAQVQVSAANQAPVGSAQQAARMQIVAQHNLSKYGPAKLNAKGQPFWGLGHSHPACKYVPADSLTDQAGAAKVQALRAKFGAMPAAIAK
jgi:hypothetical protein